MSHAQGISTLAGIVLMAVGLVAIHRAERRFTLFEPSPAPIVLVRVFAIGLVRLCGAVW